MKKTVLRLVVIAASVALILAGIYRDEVAVVFSKAVNICFECIGLG